MISLISTPEYKRGNRTWARQPHAGYIFIYLYDLKKKYRKHAGGALSSVHRLCV